MSMKHSMQIAALEAAVKKLQEDVQGLKDLETAMREGKRTALMSEEKKAEMKARMEKVRAARKKNG